MTAFPHKIRVPSSINGVGAVKVKRASGALWEWARGPRVEWCCTNVGLPGVDWDFDDSQSAGGYTVYVFKRVEDAALFALKWS